MLTLTTNEPASVNDSTLYVTVKSDEAFLADAGNAVEALADGESVERANELSFPTIEMLFREFTPKKIELLQAVTEKQPESISQTAKLVGRDVKNVHQNLTELAQLDVIEFVENGQAKQPVARYDSLRIEVPFDPPSGHGGSAALAD